jgi:hypothetical protein
VDRLAQGCQLRPVHALQAAVRCLQRNQRGLHVAGERELLARDEQRLLDLGVGPFVAIARKLLVERTQRGSLILGFCEPALESAELCLRCGDCLACLLRRAPVVPAFGGIRGEFRGRLLAQRGGLSAAVIPLPRGEGESEQRDPQRRIGAAGA